MKHLQGGIAGARLRAPGSGARPARHPPRRRSGHPGWYVPQYVIQGAPASEIGALAPDLKWVAGRPRYGALFRADEEPAKARFLNCTAGWTCEGVNFRS